MKAVGVADEQPADLEAAAGHGELGDADPEHRWCSECLLVGEGLDRAGLRAAIAEADVVLLAADIDVATERFAGKKIYRCGTGIALKQSEATLKKALAEGAVESAAADGKVVGSCEAGTKEIVYKRG